MSSQNVGDLVKVGGRIVKLSAVTSSHWEGEKFFVYLDGGRFFQMRGADAQLLAKAIDSRAVDLRTGEVLDDGCNTPPQSLEH